MSNLTWPSWKFGQPQDMTKQRNSVSAEFFNNPDVIPTDCVALVREAIQNSLDQRLDPNLPARVVITVSGPKNTLAPAVAQKYFDGLDSHLESLNVDTTIFAGRCNYLVFEDFQTTGLRGDPATLKETKDANDFLYFFRVEGRSNKQGNKERGKWGIGKYVFPMSSAISTFFGYSIRPNETYGDRNGLLFGQSTLSYHSVGDNEYEPDGWWGEQSEPGKIVTPVTSADKVNDFVNDWNLTRKPGESGLSLVIPYLRQPEKWELKSVVRAVIEDYFSPILRNQLIVTVREINGEAYDLDNSSIEKTIPLVFDDEAARTSIEASLSALRWADTAPAYELSTHFSGAPGWNVVEAFDKENLASLRTSFERDGKIKIRIPITVSPEEDPSLETETFYDLLLITEHENVRHSPTFIRSGLMVKQASDARIPGVRSFALIDETVLSSFLGNAEGPAHITWSQDTKAFQGKYKYGPSWLTFIKKSPERLLEKLRGDDAEPDTGIAEEFFPIPHGKRGGKPVTPREPAKPKIASISKVDGGFKISIDDSRSSVPDLEVRVAFDVRKGNPFAKWVKEDFNFDGDDSTLKVESSGCVVVATGNSVLLTSVSPKTFEFKVTGFDQRRDLRVDVESV